MKTWYTDIKYLKISVMNANSTLLAGKQAYHAQRDFSRFSAPVMEPHYAGGGEEFTREAGLPGNFYPPNLTPHHLGEWTDGELYRAITAGVNKAGKSLFPAMPYHLYG